MSTEIGILIILIIMLPSVVALSNTVKIIKELSEIKESLRGLSKPKEDH